MIALIEGCGANIASIQYALMRLGARFTLTRDPQIICLATHVVIPGVSTAKTAMENLLQHDLVDVIKNLSTPVIGICSGMQVLFESSEEGNVRGLGIFPGKVKKLTVKNETLPHMGWNQLHKVKPENQLLQGISNKDYVYFVHSFAASPSEYTAAICKYGDPFSAVVQKDNFYGTQFHPEKSGTVGLKILRNFLDLGTMYANYSSY